MTVPPCPGFITNGFMLQDLDQVRAAVYQAIRAYAASHANNQLPSQFLCSYDNQYHALTPEEIRDALFHGPGAWDYVATYNELDGLINGTAAAAAGVGVFNGVSSTSDAEFEQIMTPATPVNTPADPDPVLSDLSTSDGNNIEKVDHEIVVNSGGS
jgi:hypothetical protein